MSAMLSSIENTFTTAFSTTVGYTTHAFNQAQAYGFQLVNYVSPKLSGIVGKIQSLDFPTYTSGLVSFAKSPVGVTTITLSGAVLCLVASRRVENKIARGLLLLAGVTSIIFSAVALTSPFGVKA